MADTGNKAGSYAHATVSAADVDATAVNDAAGLTTDAINNSVTTARIGYTVSVGVVEDNTGAIDGVCTVGVLGTDGDPDSEGYQTTADPYWSFTFTPVQNAESIAAPFCVYGDTYPKFKLYFFNDSGQQLTVTINLTPITVPLAS